MCVDSRDYCLTIRPLEAGIAQLVEHNLAKVGVASSSLVSRSNIIYRLARWQSGYAAACKAVNAGSIPTLASIPKDPSGPLE